jgi:omega-hydroxy-beta-dihydromenaquinone-9 sulfotransferase
MLMSDWLRLLARNRFRVHPARWGLVATVGFATVINSVLRLVQTAVYSKKVAGTEIAEPPIFIIGHWRSGTTYLHELLVQDERYSYPNTYECFAPNHFLVTRRTLPWLIHLLLPKQRPMDNMLTGAYYPQEDEFALGNLGCPTPYWRMVFPNEPPCYMELLDMQGVAPSLLARWKRDMDWFVRAMTFYKRKPLILKSPPHTGRVGLLAEMFPQARFIHITRNPETLFASTRRLWPTLDLAQGLQIPRNEHLDEYIFEAFERMYRGFESQRLGLPPNQIIDVRYEDLVADPIAQVERIYGQLEIGGLEVVRERLLAFIGQRKDYKPNRHDELEPEIRAAIRRRWAGYIDKYGYAAELG